MRTLAAAAVAASTLLALAGPAAAAEPGPAACPGAPLMGALGALRTSAGLAVERTPTRVTVKDRGRDRVLLVATCAGLEVAGPTDARRPEGDAAPAATEVVRDKRGAVLYTHSVTALGARVTVFAPGPATRAGLDVTAFDNDDVYVADAAGALLYQRQTTPEGALVEREAAKLGCGCERVTAPDGRVSERPLATR